VSLHLSASRDIHAPPALVFELVSTPERLPEWNTSVESSRRAAPGDQVGRGSRALMQGRLLGQRLESETEVVEYEPPRAFATHALRGPRLHTRFRLEPIPGGTRLDLEVRGDVPGGRVGEMLAEGFLRTEFAASLDRLRQLAEAEARELPRAE